MKWSTYINSMRHYLGLTVPQMARLVGVSQEVMEGWLYRGTTPSPLHQDLLKRLSETLPAVKEKLDSARQNPDSSDNTWQYVLVGVGVVGIAYTIYKLLDLLFNTPPQEPKP